MDEGKNNMVFTKIDSEVRKAIKYHAIINGCWNCKHNEVYTDNCNDCISFYKDGWEKVEND